MTLVQQFRLSTLVVDGHPTLHDAECSLYNNFVTIVDDLIYLGLLSEDRTRRDRALHMMHLLLRSVFDTKLFLHQHSSGVSVTSAVATPVGPSPTTMDAMTDTRIPSPTNTPTGSPPREDGATSPPLRVAAHPHVSASLSSKVLQPWVMQFARLLNVYFSSSEIQPLVGLYARILRKSGGGGMLTSKMPKAKREHSSSSTGSTSSSTSSSRQVDDTVLQTAVTTQPRRPDDVLKRMSDGPAAIIGGRPMGGGGGGGVGSAAVPKSVTGEATAPAL